MESAFVRLADMPRIGKEREFRNTRLTGVRFWPIPGFVKSLIFYRVLHGAQDIQAILDRRGGLHHDT